MGKGNLPSNRRSSVLINHCGAGLIEVLVAALVLSLGVTSVLQLQTFGLLLTHSASQRQTAFLLLMDLSERVRIVSAEFRELDDLSLNSTSAMSLSCANLTPCSSEQFARQQLAFWRQHAATVLVEAEVTINREQTHDAVYWQVSIGWFADAGDHISARIGL